MIIGDKGLKLIAEFEGFAGYLYNDPVGHATVAYGFLVHLGNYHDPRGICAKCDLWPRMREPKATWLSPAKGRELLREKVKSYAEAVERMSVPLNQNQFDALTSFCYNVGPGGYLNSSVRRAVNGGGDVCAELRKYVKGTDGITYPGLVRRREAECELYYEEDDDLSQEQFDAVKSAIAELAKNNAADFKKLQDANAFVGEELALILAGKNDEAEKRLRYVFAAAGRPYP